jgi:hypothetical protein
VLKAAYSSRPTDVFLDASQRREQIAQKRNEYDQAMHYVDEWLNDHTTYGERRLLELGLTFTAVSKVAVAGTATKVVNKADAPNIKPHTATGDSEGKLGEATYVQDHYLKAINSGKHAVLAKQYIDKPYKEIEKGIRSLEKQIELHKDKIRNPDKYYPDFYKEDIRRQEANINKIWPNEIINFKEQKHILEGILKNRETK